MSPTVQKFLIITIARMFDDLKDKNILIVGASKGIGKQLALTLHSLGTKVHLAARNIEALNLIKQDEFNCSVYQCDIDKDEDVQSLAASIDSLDGVCIVSGMVKLIPPKMLSKKMIDAQIITNLASPLNIVGSLLRKNKLKDGASIVFTSAAGRLCQPPCTAAYAGAKLGLHGAARSLAVDLAPKKIRVNTVSFDYVETDMIKAVQPETVDIIGIAPLEYSSMPYLFILSEMSRWISGQILAADAGRMLGKVRYV
jgi:NAD(P)-dependent dehydrogenase (short-subunit alcohol dehydrogenase family)